MSEKMSTQDATRFENGKSETHEILLTLAAEQRGCSCQPYQDWFTYKRWKAQALQVKKGEKGYQLTTFASTEVADPKTGEIKKKSRPWRTYVFCRCQVA